MWRGHEIAALDHEKCFGYLTLVSEANRTRPWRDFFARRALQHHCLVPEARRTLRDAFGEEIRENLVGLEIGERVSEFAQATTAAFPEARMEIDRISVYIEALFRDTEDLLDCLKHAIAQ